VWSARSEVVDVYLSGSTFALRRGHDASECHAIEPDQAMETLQAALVASPRCRWRVWLGGRLCSLHAVEPVEGIRHIEEAEAAVSALLSTDGRVVSARLAIWAPGSGAPWVAAGMPVGLPERCEELVSASGGKLLSLRPWWRAFASSLGATAALCDDEAISYWRSGPDRQVDAGSFIVANDRRAVSLQRLQVGGPLPAWSLQLHVPKASNGAGFAVERMNEDPDVAASPSV
jgi:hypothetical protein